ncbi:MAG: hypothetical protein HY342_11155 [Candidatus Lambdaproteobacteria bacterium]|nr:hypothetical protein [Candidatus Lambdaproteobacteria bacterium]
MTQSTCKAKVPDTALFKGECPHEPLPGEDYCVYHRPVELWRKVNSLVELEAAGTAFKKIIQEAIKMQRLAELDCRGWVFPDKSCPHLIHESNVRFSKVDFSQASFLGQVRPKLKVERNPILFTDVSFHQSVSFAQVKEPRGFFVDFSGATFHMSADFSSVNYSTVSGFALKDAKFNSEAKFHNSQFRASNKTWNEAPLSRSLHSRAS